MPLTITKKVNLELAGLDSNAFVLIGAFQRQARKEGWTKEEIAEVREKAMSGDYDHLLCTLTDVCESADCGDCGESLGKDGECHNEDCGACDPKTDPY